MRSKSEAPDEQQDHSESDRGRRSQAYYVNAKPRVRRLKLWAIWFGLACLSAGYLLSCGLFYLSLACVLICFVVAAIVHRFDAINNGAKHRQANQQSILIIIAGVLICVGLLWWRINQPTDNIASDTYKTVTNVYKAVTEMAQRPPLSSARGGGGDYVEGTEVTHSWLKSNFPFGYVVFSFRDGLWTFQPKLNEAQLRVTANWAEVKITPDFRSKMVYWDVPEVSFDLNSPEIKRLKGRGNRIQQPVPMNTDAVCAIRLPFNPPNQPVLHLATLSDNQVNPVFLLGFRIPQEFH